MVFSNTGRRGQGKELGLIASRAVIVSMLVIANRAVSTSQGIDCKPGSDCKQGRDYEQGSESKQSIACKQGSDCYPGSDCKQGSDSLTSEPSWEIFSAISNKNKVEYWGCFGREKQTRMATSNVLRAKLFHYNCFLTH